ncbi:hypothetical protein [Streptomyces sp. NPDC088925]|uniref:hypothetical protein n=1 Tax=Streptomyces sp. NPDC088925 TaxID=3365914 RepID=UPI00380734B8
MAPHHGYRPALRAAAINAVLRVAAQALALRHDEPFAETDRRELVHDLGGRGEFGSALDDAMPRVTSAMTRGEYRQWLLAPNALHAAVQHDYASAADARARRSR